MGTTQPNIRKLIRLIRGIGLIISDNLLPQLQYYREFCNFTPNERELFDYRASGCTLEDCCDLLNMDISSVKRLSRKVNKKMIAVTSVVNMDKWIEKNYG